MVPHFDFSIYFVLWQYVVVSYRLPFTAVLVSLMISISKEKEAAFLKFCQFTSSAAWSQISLFSFYLILISYIHTSIVDKNSLLFFLCIYFGELWTALILFFGCQPSYTHLMPLIFLCNLVWLAVFS